MEIDVDLGGSRTLHCRRVKCRVCFYLIFYALCSPTSYRKGLVLNCLLLSLPLLPAGLGYVRWRRSSPGGQVSE